MTGAPDPSDGTGAADPAVSSRSGGDDVTSPPRSPWGVVVPLAVALVALVAAVYVATRVSSDGAARDADEAAGLSAPNPGAAAVYIESSAPRYGSLPQLVKASDLIVEAEVIESVQGRWFGEPSTGGGGGRILSRMATLEVSRVLAGPTPLENRVLIEEEGWTEDGAPVRVDGLGAAEVGDRGIWFLTPGGDSEVGAYLVVNFQGRYLFRGDTLEGAKPTGSSGAEDYGFALVKEIEAMSPEELVTQIAASTVSSTAGAHPLDEPAG